MKKGGEMTRKVSLLAAVFIFAASIACASTTAVLNVRCVIPVIPPDLAQIQEQTPQDDQSASKNRGFIVQTEEKEEGDSRIVIRTAVAK